MRRRRQRRVAIALLEYVLPDDEPLTGDLVEESLHRSDMWFWRQVLYAVLTRTIHSIRMNSRVTIGGALVAVAIIVLVGFEAVVAASLATDLFGLQDLAWMPLTGRHHEWLAYSGMSLFVAAVAVGRSMGCFHPANRIATILACGASATVAALVNLWLFVPHTPLQPVMPSLPAQIAFSTVFVVGLLAGAGWRFLCEPAPSS